MVRYSQNKIRHIQASAHVASLNTIAEGNTGYMPESQSTKKVTDTVTALRQIQMYAEKVSRGILEQKTGIKKTIRILRKHLPVSYVKVIQLLNSFQHTTIAKDGTVPHNLESYITNSCELAKKKKKVCIQKNIIGTFSLLSLPILLNRKPIGILVVLFDETVTQTDQNFLELTHDYFVKMLPLSPVFNLDKDSLLDSLPQGIIVRDMDDKVIYCNRIAIESAQNRDEILAQRTEGITITPHWDTIDDQGKSLQGESIPSIFTSRTGNIIQGELYSLKLDPIAYPERTIPILVSTSPLKNEESQQIGSIAVFHDFSVVKNNQQIVIDYLKREIHLIKTYLTTMSMRTSSMLELVKTSPMSDQAKEKYLNHHRIVEQQSDRIVSTINFLVETDLPALGIKIRFSLTKKVIEIVNEISNATLRKIGIVNHASNTDLPVFASLSDIITVVRHLIENAMKYSNNDTIIEITLNNQIYKGQEMACFSIRDHGFGIDSKKASNLFKKFSRLTVTKPDGTLIQGAGFGLFDCKNIINSSGGQISYSPAPEEDGSIFSFLIPIVPDVR